MKVSLFIPILLALGMLINGCNVSKNVPPNEYLYTGTRFSISDSLDPEVQREAEKAIANRKNFRMLGIPYKLLIYNMFSSPGRPSHGMLRKLGEPPVLLSQVDTLAMIAGLRELLFRSGYFKSDIRAVPEKTDRKADINFTIRAGKRYVIGRVTFPKDSLGIPHEILATSDSSLLHAGEYIRLDVLTRERERINESLKNKGYFLFNAEQIAFRADTLAGLDNHLHLYLKHTDDMKTQKIWTIGKVFVHNSDTVMGDSSGQSIPLAPITGRDLPMQRAAGYKTSVYRNAMLLKEGDIYSKQKHYLSIQRLINLQTFQFVKVSFIQHTVDSANRLTTHLYVKPAKRYNAKFDISAGAKGNNYLGSKLSSSLINNNVFAGAEKLQLELQGGGDIQFGGNRLGANSINFGGSIGLSAPRLLPRFHIDGGLNPSLPETKVSISTNYIRVPKLFSVVLTGISLDYQFLSNRKAEHNLTPFEVATFRLHSASALFDSVLIIVPTLSKTFRSQLLLGSAYRLWINKPSTPGGWFQGSAGLKVKTSGNLLGLLVRNKTGLDGGKSLAGLPISQFLKLEGELRGFIKANEANTLAVRTLVGVGLAYGNSSSLPYTEQFFIGGSNSLRAFRAGTLGPGSYHSEKKILSNIEYGDFKLEMNVEWRGEVNSTIKIATFIDAGNVWIRRKDPTKPGADLSHFFSEIAAGTGVGLRLDFSLFLLRFDLGMPVRKPWHEKGKRWVFHEFDPLGKAWRKQNLILNFGVGYPF